MSRKKVRRRGWLPETERSLHSHLTMRDNAHTLDRREVLDLVRGGEDSEVEFKVRYSNPERIAAEILALANSGGGAILFGVSDTCRVEGLDDAERVEVELRELCATVMSPPVHPYINKVAFDSGKRVLVLEVDDRRAPHASRDGKYYIRIGSTKREADSQEIAELFHRYNAARYEQVPLHQVSFDDIDDAGVWSYLRAVVPDESRLPKGFPTAMAMTDMRLAVMTADDYVPTVAGLVLFGQSRAMERSFPRSHITLTRLAGHDASAPVIEQATFTGNVASLYWRAESFLTRYVDLHDAPLTRREARTDADARAAYSRPAVMEALTNALVHRDYGIRQEGIRIMLYDRRLELSNPAVGKHIWRGALDYGVSHPNNPSIKSFFKNTAYGVTTYAGGLPMVRRETLRFARREPKITTLPHEFRIELPAANAQ
ncbi:putative DNA binding domain-containing protein [Chloracidobacterium validum]|uniref:DNA binding domain-containing protein n=1 Tax=Chloracidobacterium validum TaxID=2821543 RepID=A0ABX8BAX5_9BACT|nr:RNA-binding domain-containing protein [Chloracidobacterium validum]QUW03829.1 putative DNA binding domain-containing protein [Chloracidobacterium validum]